VVAAGWATVNDDLGMVSSELGPGYQSGLGIASVIAAARRGPVTLKEKLYGPQPWN
jgi:hypothetical protein